MMKTDNPLTAILDEEIDNIEDLNAKHQLVKELNSYFSNNHKKVLKQIGNEFYETYVWFSHLRTHSDGNACQPLTQIFLPNQKKIKLKDRRFKINQRQYEKVCIQCNQDEDKYKIATRSLFLKQP